MIVKVVEIATGKEVTAPDGGYAYNTEGIVIGLDGRVYTLDDNGACGDPECCGERSYYYQDVTEQYEITILPDETPDDTEEE